MRSFLFFHLVFVCLFVLSILVYSLLFVLGIESRTLQELGKHLTTELESQPHGTVYNEALYCHMTHMKIYSTPREFKGQSQSPVLPELNFPLLLIACLYGKCNSTLDEKRRLLQAGNSVHRKPAVTQCLEAGRNQ